MYKFLYTDDFSGSLARLDKSIKSQVKNRLRFLVRVENPLLFSKRLKGYRNIYRFRVGDYRIIFRLSGQSVILLLVDHRKNIYDVKFS